jgi:ferric-dicitrate binding protein FerR (iron transport regulator)
MSEPSLHGERSPRHVELIERYFDGMLADAELTELERLLVADPEVAAAFAAASREEQQYADHFRLLRDTAVVDELLRTAQESTTSSSAPSPLRPSVPPPPSPTVSPSLRPSFSLSPPLVAAALLLLLVGGGLYWAATRNPAVRPAAGSPSPQVIAGALTYGGRLPAPAGTGTIPRNVPFEVAGTTPAVLRLADGSQAELAPATHAELRGDAHAPFPSVVLESGSARFQVAETPSTAEADPLRVVTPIGNVTARGTEFTVEVRPADALLLAPPQLLVAVLAGEVSVDYGDQTYALGLGDDRIYAAAEPIPASQPDLVGRVASVVHADDGQSTTINVESRKSATTKAGVQKIRLTGATRLSWVNVPVDRQKPSVGYTASVWRDPAQPAVAGAVQFEAAADVGPPPQLSGLVTEVSPDASAGRYKITLELPAHAAKHQPSRRRTITVDGSTKVNYFFLPPSAEQPTAGYRATVWLADGAGDRARTINFSGDKRGRYRPDLSGVVDGMSNDGREWKLTVKEKVPGKGVQVVSRVVRIAPDTRIVFDGEPAAMPSPLRQEAAVWLREGSSDTAAGIRLSPR